MKERLETSRGIVRALAGACPELRELTARWPGRPDSVWRKRLARHIRGCGYCGDAREPVVPAERLIVGIALVPVPAGFTLSLVLGGKTAAAATTVGWSTKVLGALTKPAVAVTAGATLVAGGAYIAVRTPTHRPPARHPHPRRTARPSSPRHVGLAAPVGLTFTHPLTHAFADPAEGRLRHGRRRRRPGTRPGHAPGRAAPPARDRHHQHRRCQGRDAAPRGQCHAQRPGLCPGPLADPAQVPARLAGSACLDRADGQAVPRRLGRRPPDGRPLAGSPDGYATGMGGPTIGYAVLPAGTQQMWQNEYFYLDGTVTLTVNERGCDYGVIVFPSTWQAVHQDVTTGPPQGTIRFGLVRDDGKDSAPVPQYLTRATPADPATVPQRSRV
ncbi:sigma-70 family RNA polymerase sigma factor [Streptomyces diastatochromogenes]|nr:sigma-70 family RNA polymerase sigma factor [Streptomyces diastatochromogenes]